MVYFRSVFKFLTAFELNKNFLSRYKSDLFKQKLNIKAYLRVKARKKN